MGGQLAGALGLLQPGQVWGDEWPPSPCCPPLGGTGSPAMLSLSLSLSPSTARPALTPFQHRGIRAQRSIPVPLGAGVTQEPGIPTCPVPKRTLSLLAGQETPGHCASTAQQDLKQPSTGLLPAQIQSTALHQLLGRKLIKK